jgi:hypothetical protein
MLHRLLRSALIALPAVLLAAGLPAQAVRATVTDAATGAPVAGAMVRVEDESGVLVRAGFSDERGTLRLPLREGGRHVVRAERTGYAPAEAALVVADDGETAATLRMRANPLGLDTVRVVAPATRREVGRQTFERRRAGGRGIYLDSAYVAARPGNWPADLLQSVPGIEVRTVHGSTGIRRPSTRQGGRCLNALVNGLPYYGGWPRWVSLEETLRRSDVVAVEVYVVFEDVPRELQRYARANGVCGLIVYWTEDGWQSRSRGADSGS